MRFWIGSRSITPNVPGAIREQQCRPGFHPLPAFLCVERRGAERTNHSIRVVHDSLLTVTVKIDLPQGVDWSKKGQNAKISPVCLVF